MSIRAFFFFFLTSYSEKGKKEDFEIQNYEFFIKKIKNKQNADLKVFFYVQAFFYNTKRIKITYLLIFKALINPPKNLTLRKQCTNQINH